MPRFPDHLPDDKRIAIAKERTGKLIDHLLALFTMHETNAIVTYSPIISKQIPRSRAASAFNQTQKILYLFEIIRLCALWDSCREDRESAPTILALINTPDILKKLVDGRHEKYANQLSPYNMHAIDDPEIAEMTKRWWENDQAQTADYEAWLTRHRLLAAIHRIEAMQANPVLKALRDFRDEHIAHNLDPARPTKGDKRPRYGDERRLLRETIKIADLLHSGLNDTGFMWLDARRQARREARALWMRCTFDIDPKE